MTSTHGPDPSVIYGWETGYFNGTQTLAGRDATSGLTVPFEVCEAERPSCLKETCESCILHPYLAPEAEAEKLEGPCDTLFSGGPVLDAEGKMYDCGVRLAAGTRGSGSDLDAGDGISSGRVEGKHNGVWGSVCSLGWDDNDADVLCRSIGFADGTAYTSNVSYTSNPHHN